MFRYLAMVTVGCVKSCWSPHVPHMPLAYGDGEGPASQFRLAAPISIRSPRDPGTQEATQVERNANTHRREHTVASREPPRGDGMNLPDRICPSLGDGSS
ncbi:hypothetical protein Misp02_59560 [Microtetraspora sp. NBRC 16547]|nr:hypothetical protein Misp02_59560 [Microtetraspora sp. NBRC 16547]